MQDLRGQGFPPALRLHTKREFDRVMQRGVNVSDGRLRLKVIARKEGLPTRLGITVSRKAGKAVVRNRFRRLVREAFRSCRDRLPEGLDLVVFPVHARGEEPPSLEEIKESITALAGRARERIEGRRRGVKGAGGASHKGEVVP